MRLFWERAAEIPLVAVSVFARGGSGYDDKDREGTAHHIAELAVRGAGSLDRLAIDTELDRVGASLAVHTSRDHIGYSAVCLERHLDRVVEILADVLSAPRFDATEHAKLIRETRSDLEEIRDDDAELAARYFSRLFWPGHPYARAIEGSEAALSALAKTDAAALATRFRGSMCRSNLVLGFAGCVEASDVERASSALTERLSEDTEPPSVFEIPEAPAKSGRGRVFLIDKPERSQSQVLIGHPAPHYASEAGPALLMTEAAFGGMFSSRLMQEVRVKRGWSYDASINLGRSARPSWIRTSLAPNLEVTADAIALVIDLYRTLIKDGLTAGELDLARRYIIGSMLLSRATARQRIQQQCIGAVGDLDDDFVAELPTLLRGLSLESVNNAIAAHLCADNLTIVVVGAADLAPSLASFGEVEVIPYRAY